MDASAIAQCSAVYTMVQCRQEHALEHVYMHQTTRVRAEMFRTLVMFDLHSVQSHLHGRGAKRQTCGLSVVTFDDLTDSLSSACIAQGDWSG